MAATQQSPVDMLVEKHFACEEELLALARISARSSKGLFLPQRDRDLLISRVKGVFDGLAGAYRTCRNVAISINDQDIECLRGLYQGLRNAVAEFLGVDAGTAITIDLCR